MTPSFRITHADHTGITVRDIDASLAFWRDVLGFEQLYRARRDSEFAGDVTGIPGAVIEIALLAAPGGHRIELLQYVAPDGRQHLRPRPCDVGSLHLAFTVDDLDAALTRLREHGWIAPGTPRPIEGGSRHGTRVVYVQDPDGTIIELMQPACGLSGAG